MDLGTGILAELDFRWLFDSAPDAMVIVDARGVIALANPQVEQMFGYAPGELIGAPIEQLMPARYRQRHTAHREEYTRHPRRRPMGAGLLLYGRRSDGTEFPVEISLNAIRTGHGLMSLAAIRDVTERRAAEHELEQHRHHLQELVNERTAALTRANDRLHREIAERKCVEAHQERLLAEIAAANEELKKFAYVVSHDLKAPLRAIGSLAEWIAEDNADRLDEEGRRRLGLLTDRVQRMHTLIEGILEYSRLGQIREQKVAVDLKEAVKEAVELLSPPAHIRIEIDTLPTLSAERTRMVQLFQNLIGNAIRHHDKPSGTIRITCTALPDAWEISVADDGPGIDPTQHDTIFEIFRSVSSRDAKEGTGIGLALVKRIVELAGGRIRVESQLGAGATFRFTLPRNGHENDDP